MNLVIRIYAHVILSPQKTCFHGIDLELIALFESISASQIPVSVPGLTIRQFIVLQHINSDLMLGRCFFHALFFKIQCTFRGKHRVDLFCDCFVRSCCIGFTDQAPDIIKFILQLISVFHCQLAVLPGLLFIRYGSIIQHF